MHDYKHRRDFFVTADKHFLINRDSLKARFGVVILRPDECVSLLHSEFEVAIREKYAGSKNG